MQIRKLGSKRLIVSYNKCNESRPKQHRASPKRNPNMSKSNANPQLQSWGRFPKAVNQRAFAPLEISDVSNAIAAGAAASGVLPRGLGRSYGDSCLNENGCLVLSRHLDHLLSFSPDTGHLRCEAGVSFADILEFAVPRGFFLPVTPGTKFITVGGAIANDIHGKNHHGFGNFGQHLICFELIRSDGRRLICSRQENPDMFAATIGGLGLTGFITWAEFRLKKVAGPWIEEQTIKFPNLDSFFKHSEDSEKSHEYTVAWIDCLASGKSLGRGLFFRGNHSEQSEPTSKAAPLWHSLLNVPFDLPSWALNPYTMLLGNTAYYERVRRTIADHRVHYDPFFYPLDVVLNWNRLYGKRGFLQYQLVVPLANGDQAIRKILGAIARARLGSFLAVLKIFGDVPSIGMLSFPQPGITLALDFPNAGQTLFSLFRQLDEWVMQAGGRVYPAKDSRMSPEVFRSSFPQYKKFSQFIDPKFSSSFWRRVGAS